MRSWKTAYWSPIWVSLHHLTESASYFQLGESSFLLSSWYRVVFWIWYETDTENTLCCWAMLSLSQGLSSFPCSASKQVHKRLGGSTATTADPKWPKGYSIPQKVTPSIETGSSWWVGAHHCWGTSWASVSRWWAIALYITCGFWFFSPCLFLSPISLYY